MTCLIRCARLAFGLLCLPVVMAMLLSGAAGQGLSSRTITIIVPFTPGTGPDVMARLVGGELQKRWNQPVIVENKPGASGNIGSNAVARAAPDGHTILVTTNQLTGAVSLFANLPYDPIKGFEPIVELGTGAIVLCVHPSMPVSNVQEFIAYARSRPGEINYGSPGIGGPHHLAMELFKQVTHLDLKHVPYRGSAGAAQDLVGGHVAAGFLSLSVTAPLGSSVRSIGVARQERMSTTPDLPTIAEQGVTGFEVELWFGMLAPGGTPKEIVVRYNSAVNEILREPHIVEAAAKQGIVVLGGTADEFAAFLLRDLATWERVVREANIKAE